MATLLLIVGCAVLWAPAAFSQGHGSGSPGQSAGAPGNGNGNPPGQGSGHGNGGGSGQPQGRGNNGTPPGRGPGGGGPPGQGPGGPPGHSGAAPGGGHGQSGAPAPSASPSPAGGTGNGPGHGSGNGHGNGKGNGHGVAHGLAVGHGQGNGNGNGDGHGNGHATGATRHGSTAGTPSTTAPVTPTPVSTPTPTVTVPAPVVTPPVTLAPTPTPTPTPSSTPISTSTSTPSTRTGRPDVRRTTNPARVGTPAATSSGPLALTGLGAAALAAGALGGHATAVTQPLAPATAQTGPGHALSGRAGHRDAVLGITIPTIIPGATVIQRFVSSVPTWLWIVLAVSLGLAVIGGVAALAYRHRARETAAEVGAVTAAALTDPLTGVLNRRGFNDAAERELARARRYRHPAALAFVDVRGLKAVNDSQGHVAGDQLLRTVAALLKESARTHDLVGRIGGDELVVLLAEQSEAGAAAMARRVRAQVPVQQAALGFDADWDVTIGTATFPEDGQTLEDLLQVADRRLYRQRGIEVASAGGGQ